MKQVIYLISMKEILFIAILAIAAALPAAAQHDLSYAAEDARQRGYYDRPYLRYEAEEGACDGQLKFLNKPGRYRCSLIQTEASNSRAASINWRTRRQYLRRPKTPRRRQWRQSCGGRGN